MYIKHDWKFYKEVVLEELSKEDLVYLLQSVVEINPKVVEKWSSYPVYIEKYPNWNKRWWPITYQVGQINAHDIQWLRWQSNVWLAYNMSSIDKNDLLWMAKMI